MLKKHIFVMVLFTTCFFWVTANTAESGNPVPLNLFNIGDSIAEGEAPDGSIGEVQHDTVWSTGYNLNDIVYSLNERFENFCPTSYYENNAVRDASFNHAVSGAVMADFYDQAKEVVTAAGAIPSGKAGMVRSFWEIMMFVRRIRTNP